MRQNTLAFALLLLLPASHALAQDIDVIDPAESKHHAAAPAPAAPPPAAVPTLTSPAMAPAAVSSSPADPNLKVMQGAGTKTTSYLIKDAPLPSDFVIGKITAPLVMVEYASLSCPHCAHFSNTVLPSLIKDYVDTGKLRYILRQFPLNEPALKGAELLDCVGEQDKDKYFVFARVLFDAQAKWAFDGNFMSGLETIATVGGLTREQFQACVSSTDREMKVLKAKKMAADELHVPHTPYIFIGDEVYEGDRTPEAIGKFIDAELEKGTRH